jgi:hypothetical protein
MLSVNSPCFDQVFNDRRTGGPGYSEDRVRKRNAWVFFDLLQDLVDPAALLFALPVRCIRAVHDRVKVLDELRLDVEVFNFQRENSDLMEASHGLPEFFMPQGIGFGPWTEPRAGFSGLSNIEDRLGLATGHDYVDALSCPGRVVRPDLYLPVSIDEVADEVLRLGMFQGDRFRFVEVSQHDIGDATVGDEKILDAG